MFWMACAMMLQMNVTNGPTGKGGVIMPRIRQNSERYAREDFQTEIRRQQGQYDLMSVRALSRAVDIPATTLGAKLKDPDKMEVADLRKLVTTIHPDPVVILALIGYSPTEIKRICSP